MNESTEHGYWVDIQVEQEWPFDAGALQRAALAALTQQEVPPVEVAVVVSDDETLRVLNRRYRGIDASTDVLAFPTESRGPFAGSTGQPRYLGDVVISYPRAVAQAAEGGHSVEAELQLLVVHGVLHLLGYDDQKQRQRAQMWAVQATILEALGVEIDLPE